VNRAAATLPSLPLWLAAMIALATEAALVTGLAQLPSLQVVAPPQIPIEISFVAAPALTESAAVEAVSGISSAPQIPPDPPFSKGGDEVAPEPEPPVAPAPAPLPIPIPELTPPRVPVALAAVKPKPQPKRKPKPKLKPLPPVQPKLAQQPKPAPQIKRPVRSPAVAKSAPASHSPPQPIDKPSRSPATSATKTASSSAAAYLSNPAPAYPDGARRLRQEGTVQLRVLVSPSGSASTVSIANSSGVASLDQAALRAVQRWRFKPAQRDGLAVAATVQVPIRFKLN